MVESFFIPVIVGVITAVSGAIAGALINHILDKNKKSPKRD